MMKALVTGSSGFIGRHMTQELLRRGYTVTQVDIEGTSATTPIDALAFFSNSEAHYDLVVHAAAQIGGRVGIEHRALKTGSANLQLDAAMFGWALRTRPEHIVYLSSSAVYPVELQRNAKMKYLQERSVSLDRPGLPDELYGWTKLTGEQLTDAALASGIQIHVVRPFSGYGSDQSIDYPFGSFLDRTMQRRDPFRIWGDGTQIRDWIHVDDVINAILTIVESNVLDPVNICTGRATSFNELAQMFFSIFSDITGEKYSPELQHVLSAPRGVSYRVGAPGQLLKIYTPRISLEQGIARAIKSRLECA